MEHIFAKEGALMAEAARQRTTRDGPHGSPAHAVSGHQNGHRLATQTTAYLIWETMSQEERLGVILRDGVTADWLDEPYLPVLAHFRPDPIVWGKIMVEWQERRQRPRELENAVDHY